MLLHTVAPVVKWDISATVTLNKSTNGSCLASGNPRPLAEVNFLHNNCDYSSKPIIINDFTTRVEFRIHRVTEDCKVVFCDIPNYFGPDSRMSLSITGKPSQAKFALINDYDILFVSSPKVTNHTATDTDVYKVTNHTDSPPNNTVYDDSAAKRFSMDIYVLFVTFVIASVLPSLSQCI